MSLKRLRAGIGVRRRPDRFTLLLAAIAVAGAALALARQVGYGVGLVADAPTYLTVADSLRAGAGFTQYSIYSYLHWPPLYPVLLAVGSLWVFDPRDVAGPLNAAVFALTIFAVGHCLRRHLQHRFLVVGAGLTIMLAIPLTSVAAAALSEPLFILLITLSLAQTAKFLDHGKSRDLALAATLTGLALLTRYTGIVVVLAILPLLISQRGVGWLEKAKGVFLYGLIAGLPTALWLLRNQLEYGRIRGDQYTAPYSLAAAMDEIGNALAGWALRYNPDSSTAAVFAWIALAALLAGVVYALLRRRSGAEGRWFWGLCAGFALAYLAFLVAVKAVINPQDWGGRYLAPAYIPLLITAVFAVDRLLSYAARRNLRWLAGRLPIISAALVKSGTGITSRLAIGVALVMCAWLAVGAALNVRDIRASNLYGAGLDGRQWANSEVLQYLRGLPAGSTIYSNALAVYFHTGHKDYRFIPSSLQDDTPQIAKAPDGAYLAWLYNVAGESSGNFDGGIPALRRMSGLAPVAELADGFIVRVNRDYSPATDYYRAAYAGIAAGAYGAPAARSVYDIYRHENTLIYARESCAAADLEPMFLLHLTPGDANDLPRHRRDDGFDNRDFAFRKYGAAFDGICLAVVPLPDYDIARLRTGQFVPDAGRLWTAELPSAYYRAAYARIAAGDYGAPAVQSAFDIYHDGNTLLYAREPCAAANIEALFLLHLIPEDTADLPQDRQEYGYGNRDFDFREYGAAFDGVCVAVVPLPDYEIAGVRTGQFIPDAGRLWTAEFDLASELRNLLKLR